MKALVTGATGFIGSKLVTKLVDRGVSVTCLVRSGSISNPAVKTINGDLTYPDFVFPDERYDVVYHLAAVWPGEKDKKKARTVNYDITAMQNGAEVLSESGMHEHTGEGMHVIDALASDSPVDVKVTILGIGLPDDQANWTGPKGDVVFLQIVQS